MTAHDASTGQEYERGDAGPGRRPVSTAARGPDRPLASTLPRGAAFWLGGGGVFLLFFAAAARSPLSGVSQSRWRFSATTLTAVFAAYAVLLLATLLVFGPVSDYLGRRVIM